MMLCFTRAAENVKKNKKGKNMNLASTVVFTFNGDGLAAPVHQVEDFQDFRNKFHQYYESLSDIIPDIVQIQRSVYIIEDVSDIRPAIKAKINGGTFTFIVADKLYYPKDVREYLMKEYGETLGFENWSVSEKTPVLFNGVHEYESRPLRDTETGQLRTISTKSVMCRSLNKNDRVLDKNLNMMWPRKGKIPPQLISFFNQKHERIRTK